MYIYVYICGFDYIITDIAVMWKVKMGNNNIFFCGSMHTSTNPYKLVCQAMKVSTSLAAWMLWEPMMPVPAFQRHMTS